MLDRDELMGLRGELRAEDPLRREQAASRLQSLVQSTVPPLLIEALGSDSAEVRDQALVLLARMAEQGDETLQQVVDAVRSAGAGA